MFDTSSKSICLCLDAVHYNRWCMLDVVEDGDAEEKIRVLARKIEESICNL